MSSNPSPFDHQFEKLMKLDDNAEREELIAELLHHGNSLIAPLVEFIESQEQSPQLSPLIDLLGKIMDDRSLAALMRYLESAVPELRRSAANALGWNRARAGLEALDQMEGNDPDELVRLECRAAIEEILREYPKLRVFLKHHRRMEDLDPEIAGEHDTVPVGEPDRDQKIKLMAALPRLLALKYRALPIHFSPGDRLHVAVPPGRERKLARRLAELTGHFVELHTWQSEYIKREIDAFYTLGDDDFCYFHDKLTGIARDEVVASILTSAAPDEMAGPLNEANDAVEAFHLFTRAGYTMDLREVLITYRPPEMIIMSERTDSAPVRLEPPEGRLRERFLGTLRILAGLEPGLEHNQKGTIRIPGCQPVCLLHVESEKGLEEESLKIRFEKE